MLHKTGAALPGQRGVGELDYLLVDLPPGTGDVQLTLCQSIPLTARRSSRRRRNVGAKVAQKAITMFLQAQHAGAGVIENMAHYICPHCGAEDEVFGSGGARRAAERLEIPFLGRSPSPR